MKPLALLASAFLLLTCASQAVTWHVVTISIVVQQGGAEVTKTMLNATKYLEEGVRRSPGVLGGTGDSDKKNYFVGFRTDTKEVAVVHKPSETVVYRIVSGLTTQGVAQNAAGTKGTAAGTATVSSLNTDFNGACFFDKFSFKPDLSIISIAREVRGATGSQTITGTIRTTPKKYEL